MVDKVKKTKSVDSVRKKSFYLLPNVFTTGALFAGFYSIVQAMNGHYDHAAIAIFVALIMDGLDGRVARLTQTQSAFGGEYDSCQIWSLLVSRPRLLFMYGPYNLWVVWVGLQLLFIAHAQPSDLQGSM